LPHLIRQYSLESGALEIQYLEEYFEEFQRKKTAEEVVRRLSGREHLILLALSSSPEDPETFVPVAFKVGHELRRSEREPKLCDLVERLSSCVQFDGRRVFYSWIGGTRTEWRGRGHYRALTEQQEEWAQRHGFNEMVVKTKNRFYAMRSTLDHLRFNIVKFEYNPLDIGESKLYLSKKLSPETMEEHKTLRTVEIAA
jgi:GNAT superfamily N-acetyltransferase